MRFALLGADADTLPLAAAAVAAGHELAWQGDLSLADRGEFPWLAAVDEAEQWEDLLIAETADAILVGRGTAGDDLRAPASPGTRAARTAPAGVVPVVRLGADVL
jgi:hypothetical protein